LEEGWEGALGIGIVKELRAGVKAFEQRGGYRAADDVICDVAVEEKDGEQASRKD